MSERSPPPWLRDGTRAAWHEARSYLVTTWAFTRSPRVFMDAWWHGRASAMNPLAMLATGATIVAAAHQLAGAVAGIDHPSSLVAALLSALGPYVHYLTIGVLVHLVLKPLARNEATWSDSVATTLYAGAGPTSLAEALGWAVMCAVWPIVRSPTAVAMMHTVAFSVFCFTLATALGRLHRAPWWATLVAFAVAFPATGLVFGILRPPGNYGLHWVLDVRNGFSLGLGM
jgi:hypothetical protein